MVEDIPDRVERHELPHQRSSRSQRVGLALSKYPKDCDRERRGCDLPRSHSERLRARPDHWAHWSFRRSRPIPYRSVRSDETKTPWARAYARAIPETEQTAARERTRVC